MELRGNGEHLPVQAADDVKAAVTGGRGIIGMSLKGGGDLENFPALERTIRQLVQAVKHAYSNRCTAAESPRLWDFPGNLARKRKGPAAGLLEKRLPDCARHRREAFPSPARNCDVIVNCQGNAEAVEAGSQVGSACRNADGGLLHDSERSKAKRDAIVTGTA